MAKSKHPLIPKQILHLLDWSVITLSILFIPGFLTYLVFQSFWIGLDVGMRSLAASLLPLIIFTYLTVFSEIFRSLRTDVPPFDLYFVSTLWMLILLLIVERFYNPTALPVIPFIELIFSFTLSVLVSIYRNLSLRAFLSCSYGLLSACLIYIIFFGFPFLEAA